VADDPDAECAEDADIKEKAKEVTLDIFLKNRYFDQYEFKESPIKNFIQYFYYPLLSDTGTALLMKVREHEMTLQDSWWGYFAKR